MSHNPHDTHEDLMDKYKRIKTKVDELSLQNKIREQKIQEHKDTIKSMGFNPENLDSEIKELRLTVSNKLTELNAKLNEVENKLDGKI